MSTYRVGVDIGGTFTDIVLIGADGAVHTKKISSSVEDYARAIVDGLAELFAERSIAPGAIEEVRHGTTVASNAILEQKGARVGLITTKGFRDVLEIRTLRVPRLYDMAWTKPPPLVERYLRQVVDERIDFRGRVERTRVAGLGGAPSPRPTPPMPNGRSASCWPKRSRPSPCASSTRSPTRSTS
jgi:N-methylhydantoinase A